MTVYGQLNLTLNEYGGLISEIRQNLYYADVASRSKPLRPELWMGVRASAFVLMAAALESCVKQTLERLLDEIRALQVRRIELRMSLFALEGYRHFDAMRVGNKMTDLGRRLDLLEEVNSGDFCSLDLSCLPLDGRTIRAQHFELIWRVFGFTGDALPSARHKLALSNIADSRNDVVHGEQSARTVGSRQSIDDIFRLVNQAEDVVIHLHEAIVRYLDSRAYLRSS